MITAVLKRTKITTLIAAGIVVAGSVYSIVFLSPALVTLRSSIDDRRANIVVSEQEQSNLDTLSKNLESIRTQQTDLDGWIWSFEVEEDFFTLWENLAEKHSVNISQPKVAEVTPKDEPINRSVTLVITGSVNNVIATINDIQRLKPLVMIDTVSFINGNLTGIIATIDAQTLWQ